MYAWVSNGSVRKYDRAVAQLIREKKDVTEEAVKALYVGWGGLVLEDNEIEIEEVVEVKPKKSKKAE